MRSILPSDCFNSSPTRTMADLLDQRASACTLVPLLYEPVVGMQRHVAVCVIGESRKWACIPTQANSC